mmetsp:Transcript_46305/g.112237  ORF Transcript_46305/g.112237 Transcript_46305/m.112237 type:complete len:179 (+) Transcript_46305:1-537(+)
MRSTSTLLLSWLCLAGLTQAFQHSGMHQMRVRNLSLSMAPKYDPVTNRWTPTSPDEEASAGYPAWGSLLRQGPSPFFQRVFNADDYDQGVLKMMARDDMSRSEAQGNMDAYIRNPNDWALQKVEEQRGAPKIDYVNANMEVGDLILTAGWSSILLAFVSRTVYLYTVGCDSFCQEYHF